MGYAARTNPNQEANRLRAIAEGKILPTPTETWRVARAAYSVLRRGFFGRFKWLLFGR